MVYERKFIEDPLLQYQIMKYLEKELDRVGLAGIDIQRTPVVTRITLEVMNPGKIIGRGGSVINRLTDSLQKEFKIQNPQISVVEVRNPILEPRLVGKRAAKMVEMGKKVRSVLHFLLREIMTNGAIGAELIISGSMSKGSRSKRMRVAAGFIPKAGEVVRLVREAHVVSVTKYGVIGIFVRIVPPGTVFPDKAEKAAAQIELPKVIAAASAVESRASS